MTASRDGPARPRPAGAKGIAAAGANRHDSPLLAPTLHAAATQLSGLLAGRRWPVERTHSWMNGYGKLRRMTDHDASIVAFYLYLAAAFVTLRALIQRARKRYRWDSRPRPPAAYAAACSHR